MTVSTFARPRRRVGLTAGIAAGAVALIIGLQGAPAAALPPGGASGDTPGTTSTVSPTTLEPCGTLNFTLHGFPAGEVVSVKIDDGQGYGDESVQGTGVVATQRISASGTASGSVQVPCDISEGDHWLRYLASEVMTDASGAQIGVKGYSNRGNSNFKVVKAGGAAATTTAAAAVTTTAGTTGTTTNTGARTNTTGTTARAAGAANTAQGARAAGTAGTAATTGTGGQAAGVVTGGAVTGGAQTVAAGGTVSTGGTAATAGGDTGNNGQPLGIDGAAFGAGGEQVLAEQGQVITPAGTVMATSASAGSNVPYIGLFIGGAILLVGLTGINTWLTVQRRSSSAAHRYHGGGTPVVPAWDPVADTRQFQPHPEEQER